MATVNAEQVAHKIEEFLCFAICPGTLVDGGGFICNEPPGHDSDHIAWGARDGELKTERMRWRV